jgi:transcriptional regulator of acetoin/glycerol metabolism
LPDRHVVRVHPTLDNEPDRAAIEAAISRSSGVLSQAASALGLSRQALYRRMERFGIARQ